MPTAKGKGSSPSHRYRPASEYDDATLAQKREYWRNKKRQQRARLSERRAKPVADRRGGKLLHLNVPAGVNSTLPSSLAAPSCPLQGNDESYSSASQSVNTAGLHTLQKLNKVLPQSPVSCSTSGKAAVKCPTVKRVGSRAFTSNTSSGARLNATSSVPPVTVTRITNGSSAKTAPQPCVSMQGASVPKTQHEAQVVPLIQPKLTPANVTTGMVLVSSPRGRSSVKMEGQTTDASPQSITNSALDTTQRAKGAGNAQPSLESEEERAARRREHWRIKKREQRAKLAARIAKARERVQGTEVTFQRLTAQTAGLGSSMFLLPSQPFCKGAGQKQGAQVRASFKSAATVAVTNLQTDQIKARSPHGGKIMQTPDVTVKNAEQSQRRFPNYIHHSNVTRGIARCKTPRQRFIEAQRNFMNQRNFRCKSPLMASVFATRSMPKIDPSDTPEQIIAKRREYWRIKKREQRAKLSMEMKARLKEKDSLMRRVKRYQKILEEMRKARALAAGNTLTHASETIGGFIKEDGTLTVNIPQSPTDHNTAEGKREEELQAVSKNTPTTQPQLHPQARHRGFGLIRINPPLQLPRQAKVKVSFPLAGQSVNKPQRLVSIRPRTQPESTQSLAVQSVGQLTLTQTSQNAVSGGSTSVSKHGGCVMKMAVSSSSAPLLSALSLDPGLTEEERMAKKREYWRIKKREQRAARAFRLKQGVLQARASVTLQRRRAQKQVAATVVSPSRSVTNHTGNAQPLPDDSTPVIPHANEIKQEGEAMPAADLHSQPEQAICPDIKPPTSPPPPPAPQLEPDPALSADSQATTLLAVASMKKLLEESLSTVAECKSEPQMETTEEAPEEDVKPNLPQLFFEKDDLAPIAADLTLQIKSWQPDSDVSIQSGPPSPQLNDSSELVSETPPHFSPSPEVVLLPTCEHSSQTTSSFIVNPSLEPSDGPSSPCRTLRLRTKTEDHQNCSPTEPPKLHHITDPPLDEQQQQQQHCEPQCEEQEPCQNNRSPPALGFCGAPPQPSGLNSLQRKREYWKLMKRQQRARLKARQRERQGESSSRLSHRNIQPAGLVVVSTVKNPSLPAKPALQPKPSITSLAVGPSIPTVLVVSQTARDAEQSPDTLRVKLPVTSREPSNINVPPSQIMSDCAGAPESPQLLPEWTTSSSNVDLAPSLPTLTPPDNPLSSINLQPIEPPGHSSNSVPSPNAQLPSPTDTTQSPNKLTPVSTMVPPKPILGESEQDFLKRKREYWRIKKKEQRARKAIQVKGVTPKRNSNNLRPILPAQDPQTQPLQDSGQWVNSSEESEHLMSESVDTDPESFAYANFTAPVEDESEMLFPDFESNTGEEGPVSDSVWRNRYLMDYDPLNQLLVCMVCGELQYSHSLEGVGAHIDEAHPHTLTLEPGEKQRILEAWDEQVSQRERFFTSQLQQHSRALAEPEED